MVTGSFGPDVVGMRGPLRELRLQSIATLVQIRTSILINVLPAICGLFLP